MKKVVLDTSVIVKWFSQEEGSQKAKKILLDLREGKIQILLPELVKEELANALLKGKQLSFSQAKKALKVFYQLPLLFIPQDLKLALGTYRLASKLKITFYDACFLALAKSERAVLITANPRHQKKIKGIQVRNL
jgi:predicted nucleic acid-binding protein